MNMSTILNLNAVPNLLNPIENDSLFKDSSLLLTVKRSDKSYVSSSVCVGRNLLLTAAHSVDQMDGASILNGSIKVKKVIVHPGYNPGASFYENDLAIVVLETNLPSNIRPEKLFTDLNFYSNECLERVGFGGRDGQNLKMYFNPEFKMSTFNQKNFVLRDDQSVVGDSGGAVFKNDDGVLKLVGIHSTLESHDKTYIVNLAKYVDWIEENRTLTLI